MNKYSKYVNTSNIRKTRTEKGITVAEIAKRMDLTCRSSYYNLENGYVEPRISQMLALSEILGMPISYLFNINK